MEKYFVFIDEIFYNINSSTVLKVNYRFSAISVKILMAIFT